MLKGYVKTVRSQQSQRSSQKPSKIICKSLQCSLQLSSGGTSSTLRSGINISAREKDWDDALGFLNQGSLGSGDDLAYKLTTHSHLRKDMLRSDFYVNRDFTIGRRDCSEAVASKMNLRSFGLYRDCSSSLCQM